MLWSTHDITGIHYHTHTHIHTQYSFCAHAIRRVNLTTKTQLFTDQKIIYGHIVKHNYCIKLQEIELFTTQQSLVCVEQVTI